MSSIVNSVAGSLGMETAGFSKSTGTEASKSTTNSRVSLGPIDPEPDPAFPYAFSGGMVNRRRPPTAIPTIPSSQPAITLPNPSSKLNGCPRSHEASNWSPVEQRTPTYCIIRKSPSPTGSPKPWTISSTTRSFGGSPSNAWT